jgi:beta-1,2-mannobiose phosphorylase / 1,2-beta-oligomannan phosphorylase
MWYSAGEQYEPDAIGYATSPDGIAWEKHRLNPVFAPSSSCPWERDRVAGMHVLKDEGFYYGFYIGFADGFEKSCVGLARSRDGVTDWQRALGNPVILPGVSGAWDDCNVYKPFVIRNKDRWMLYYNASRRSDRLEQVGLATCGVLDIRRGMGGGWSAQCSSEL